jgi:hypothetical protein
VSAYDSYEKHTDPTPRVRQESGPFSADKQLKSVADALAFCREKGLDPADVRLAHNYCIWERLETPEEVERRVQRNREAQDRHLTFVKAAYEDYLGRGLYGTEGGRRGQP